MDIERMIKPARTNVFLLAAALAISGIPAQDSFEAALIRYQQMRKRPSLDRQVAGRLQLVQTGDPRVFQTIIKDYASPGEPIDFLRGLLVTQLAEHYPKEQPRDAWRAWREASLTKEHLWLWYRAAQHDGLLENGGWREVIGQ